MSMRHSLFSSLTVLALLVVPVAASAASLFIAMPATPTAGRSVQAEIRADISDVDVNAVDGVVIIPAGWNVQRISTDGSVLSLWPVPPRFEPGEHRITFTGGAPGGIPRNPSALIFTIDLTRDASEGEGMSVSGNGYLNNGQGTKLTLKGRSGVVAAPGSPTSQPMHSNAAGIIADIGRDASLFGGQYFLSVYVPGLDPETVKVEVKEGWLSSWIRVDHYYVLHDQGLTTPITVRVTDDAGNVVERKVGPQYGMNSWAWWICGVFGLLVCAYLVMRVLRARRL